MVGWGVERLCVHVEYFYVGYLPSTVTSGLFLDSVTVKAPAVTTTVRSLGSDLVSGLFVCDTCLPIGVSLRLLRFSLALIVRNHFLPTNQINCYLEKQYLFHTDTVTTRNGIS